jgi:hypothetical protein
MWMPDMHTLSLQDQRAWRYYITKMGIHGAQTWATMSVSDRTWARVQANRLMIEAGAPHLHP